MFEVVSVILVGSISTWSRKESLITVNSWLDSVLYGA